MRREHLEALRPLCPRCRAEGREHPLALAAVHEEQGEHVVQGLLACSGEGCWQEYPILDGVPLIVADVRGFVSGQAASILLRQDLHPALAGLVGDACGPGSHYDVVRQHLSNYAWDHYASFDPEERPEGEGAGAEPPGSVVRVLERGLALAGEAALGPVLDAGCAVGRVSFELAARRPGELVLGVDLNYPMLRLAARALREGVVRYQRRRVGLVYDPRQAPLPYAPEARARVDFWALDASALPFAAGSFALATSLNLLDCLADPLGHLSSLVHTLRPGGRALLATPHDWSASATAVEAWVGGHSQRGPTEGASEPLLRALLTPGQHPAAVAGLEIVAEDPDVPWQVRLHARSRARYRAQLLALARAETNARGTSP
ncbi:MAG: methyltransferase domain-containing protein [Planctomycetota bacterium]